MVSGRRHRHHATTGGLLVLGAATLLAACGAPAPAAGTGPSPTPATVSRADVARVVAADLAPGGGVQPAVVCSDDVPAQVGAVDRCTATDLVARTRRPVTARVTVLPPQLAVDLTVGSPTTPTFDP